MSGELPLVAAPAAATTLEAELRRVLVGQPGAVRGVLIALLAGGHVLLEGPPGLGKSLLVRALAQTLALRFRRISFTPDLMPADILGTQVLASPSPSPPRFGGAFQFLPGPIFANLVLADEVNRATPRTQSALLEAMQERTVTVAGCSYALPAPFFVLATESNAEGEGLYPLPEAQLDRFLLQLRLRLPAEDALRTIAARAGELPSPPAPSPTRGEGVADALEAPPPSWGRGWGEGMGGPLLDGAGLLVLQRHTAGLPVASYVRDYAVRLVLATHPERADAPPSVRRFVRYGASPRALQGLEAAARAHALLEGRFNVAFADVRRVAPAVLRHRLRLNVEADVRGVDAESVLAAVMAAVPEELPRRRWSVARRFATLTPRGLGRWLGRSA